MTAAATRPARVEAGQLTLWAVLLAADTATQLFFKLGSAALADAAGPSALLRAGVADGWVWAGVASYAAAFLCWMLILRRAHLSLAFPLTAVVYVGVLVAAHLLLGEAVDAWRWAGVALIIGGVGLLRREDG
jgi:drug/metabolite transporter (DMT)-like permease